MSGEEPSWAAYTAHARAVAAARAAEQATGDSLLKAVALVNGGAGFATMLLLCATIRDMRDLALRLVAPLALFGFGMTVAAFAIGFVHLARSRQVTALAGREPPASPTGRPDDPASLQAVGEASRFLRLATVAVAVAMTSAILGFMLSGAILLASL